MPLTKFESGFNKGRMRSPLQCNGLVHKNVAYKRRAAQVEVKAVRTRALKV